MDRVLAIIGLRLRLLARQMRGKGGTLNLVSSIVLLLIGVLFALGLAVGFGIMIHMFVKGSDPRTLRIGAKRLRGEDLHIEGSGTFRIGNGEDARPDEPIHYELSDPENS